jgi:diguanylate cyclase (GGDEF)-like protein
MVTENQHDFPILVASQDSSGSERVSQCLVKSSAEGVEIIKAESYTDALSSHLSSQEPYTAIIVDVPEFSGDAFSVINGAVRNANGPVIIVTDCPATATACREQGNFFILPRRDLTAGLLSNMLAPAWENFKLRHTVSNLETMCHTVEKRFTDLADNFSDWLWEVDRNLNIVFSSSRKRPTQEARSGENFTTCFIPEEKSRIEDDFAELTQNPKPFYDVEYWSNDNHNSRICWSLTGIPIVDDAGEVIGFRGIAKDISADKTSLDKIYTLSNNDNLTGIYNRTKFYDELERTVRRSQRENQPASIFILDLDKFQYVNETYGHAVGDNMLVHAAKIIKNNIRSSDTVARVGGDEFGIILPDSTGSDVKYRAQALIDVLKQNPFKYQNIEIPMTASIGIASYPEHGGSADDLITRVNVAVGKAKSLGRNRLEQYNTSDRHTTPIPDKLKWLDFISKCLEEDKDRIILHFQPIVPLNSADETPRYEILVRMIDQEGNRVEAINFIEIAEEFGLISQVDRIVSFRAINLLEKWHNAGKKISLSINMSACSFEDKVFLAELSDRLRKSNLPQGALVFEITETAILRDLQNVKTAIKELRRNGALFALDDCGVGYSSFNYIKQLELDFIKIDGTFVRNLTKENKKDAAFVQALHDVARRMKILTVAESVEHAETAVELENMGIDFGQGYYFGRPGPEISEDDDIMSTVH